MIFSFLEKTVEMGKDEISEGLSAIKQNIKDSAEFALDFADKLDERTIKAFEELHAAIEAEEERLYPRPTPVAQESGNASGPEQSAPPDPPQEVAT